jgi:hypothetical protein
MVKEAATLFAFMKPSHKVVGFLLRRNDGTGFFLLHMMLEKKRYPGYYKDPGLPKYFPPSFRRSSGFWLRLRNLRNFKEMLHGKRSRHSLCFYEAVSEGLEISPSSK